MNPLMQLFRRVPGLQQLVLLVGLAAAIAGGIGGYMWLRGPTYTTAFPGLSPADALQVTQALAQAGITYRVDESGNVQVPASALTNARMQLGAKGLPTSRDGLASLSQNPGFGVSQFMETARYNYALETDLANTIGKLTGVSRAEVHLALPKASVFVADQGQPSASVLVQLVPGAHLSASQVAAITHLVASSVPKLETANVTVVDQSGQLLSDNNAPNSAITRTAREMELTQQYEHSLSAKVMNLLTPIVGDGRVRVQSQADMDYSTAEQASETYHPDPKAIRSETINTSGAGGRQLAQGVPGAFSNQPVTPPAPTGVAPPGTQPVANPPAGAQNPGGSAQTPDVPVSRNESRDYALGRSITHTTETQGRLKKLSIAVLLDDRPQKSPDGKTTTSVPMSDAQLARIQALVESAVGYDKDRGDVVTVVNTQFLEQPAATTLFPPVAATPWWKHAWVMDVARNSLAVIALLVIAFFIIRPALQALLGAGVAGGAGQAALAVTTNGVQAALPEGTLPPALGGPSTARRTYDEKVKAARDAVTQDPKRVAQIVHTMVGGNDG
ncbi:MAG: flagellar M-ring protein FliF [Nevskiaceae bacterium]|nr:MAG: flagellar M-ring protein FliF [Nevskiaceae bacterium]TBR72199.1 MAG: flagellar M-ring protein FliF [Nevskiaceae bacterium]